MTAHLETAYPEVVPEAKNVRFQEWGGEVPGDIVDGQEYLTTFSRYKDEHGKTGQSIQVNAPGAITDSPKQMCDAYESATCWGKELGDGSALLFIATNDSGNKHKTAYHYRTDGNVVMVTAYNYDPFFVGPGRDKVALTNAQIAKLATDPKLHL